MSFISSLKNIGNDIEKAIVIAEPILSLFPKIEPQATPILTDILEFIQLLEGSSATAPDTNSMSSMIQAIATTSVVKQAASKAKAAKAA